MYNDDYVDSLGSKRQIVQYARTSKKYTSALRSIYSIPGSLDDQFLRATTFLVRTAIPLAVAFGNKASM